MIYVFRVDASLHIGSGHVMRCLTLADALVKQGAQCHFISRNHTGNMLNFIQGKGHQVIMLPAQESLSQPSTKKSSREYNDWLGASIVDDFTQTQSAIKSLQLGKLVNWLVVDHYALDENWERRLRPYCQKVMVIDDLADRIHNCDLLLDQTFGRDEQDYKSLVPEDCNILTGSYYALLRPEFSKWREYSLDRRNQPILKHLLITLGGVDKNNITADVLAAVAVSKLPLDCRITVVMGANAPYITEVQELAKNFPWTTEVKINVQNIAKLMADSDLCIGASGSTSWERCCLGLPTIMLIIADNQKKIAEELFFHQAVLLCKSIKDIPCSIKKIKNNLLKFSQKSSEILDDQGLNRVIESIRTKS